MLPSLTLAFTVGLALGSFVPYFPLSIAVGLLLTTTAASLLEARRWVTPRQTTAGFCCVLLGILYWTASV
ncbi:MAG TPA: hypothetical protein VIR79_03480, partial [Nitrospira sp.]